MRDGPAPLRREQRKLAELLLRQRGLDPSQLPIPRRLDESRAPLSSTQRRLWTSAQSAGGSSYGNVPMAFRLHGALDLESLSRALSLVVERHEVLRTTFAVEEGAPVQLILAAAPVRIAVEDLRERPAVERERRFATCIREEARRPFDLTAETLLRARVFRLDDCEWGLLLVSHHLATDGWGARLLLDELSSAYAVLQAGREPDLPRLVVQYGDYAEWELEHLESDEIAAQRDYWVRRITGAPRQLPLPYDAPPSPSVATELVSVALPPDVSDALRAFARARRVTPFATVLTGFNVLLHRCGDQDDIVVGTILSRRTRSETEPLIGNFGNNLLLRTTLDADPTLAEVVDRTAATLRDAFANSDVPLELVAQAAPIPAFHVMFILRVGRYEERLVLGEARAEGIDVGSGAATLDLILDVTDGSHGIEGHLEYRTARFAPETMDRFARALEDVLTRMVREPETRLSALPKFESGRVRETTADAPRAGTAPVTRTETILARLWREWLELDTVHREDNFFRLGGDSLRAVYVLERIEKELGRRLQPEELSRATLAELAATCDGQAAAAPSIVGGAEPALTVRGVDPLDHAEAIKALFAREGLSRQVEFFDRVYPGAVQAGARSWIAVDDDRRIVGHLAVLPHRFTCGGERYTGALGANLVMDRRHRNFANAMALVQHVMDDLEQDPEVDFVFGDPNDDARAILTSIGGFTEVGIFGRFVLPVGERGILNSAVGAYLAVTLRNGDHAPLAMSRVSASQFEPGQIATPPGDTAVLRAIHPPKLYRWRMKGYPTDRDDWYLFEQGCARVAAVLVRRFEAGDQAHLCCVWREPDIALASLLGPIVTDLRGRGVRRLQVYSLFSSPLGRELRQAGFWQREQGLPFIARACSERGRALLADHVQWEITVLDCDRGLER